MVTSPPADRFVVPAPQLGAAPARSVWLGDTPQELGRAPTDGEPAAALNVPEAEVLRARRADLVGDMLGQDDPGLDHTTDIESVAAHVDDLPEREQRILMLTFYGNLTQDQIGDRLGTSQMHVSRLLTRALTYLRLQLTTDPARP